MRLVGSSLGSGVYPGGLRCFEVSPDGGSDVRLPFDATATTLDWQAYWRRADESS